MDICLVINTCKNYFKTIDNLIKQIQINNFIFPKENILIVSGQEDENSISYIEGIKIIKVVYTGLHLTSSIYIYENIHEYNNINYWILLPDTIQFGTNFFNKIFNYYNNYLKNKEICSLPFMNPSVHPTMDMGIVHTKHINNICEYLKKIKTYEINEITLKKLKKQLIYNENMIFGLNPILPKNSTSFNYINDFIYPNIFITNNHTEFVQKYLNSKIKMTYFKNLDLYKFQRNFNGPNSELIINIFP